MLSKFPTIIGFNYYVASSLVGCVASCFRFVLSFQNDCQVAVAPPEAGYYLRLVDVCAGCSCWRWKVPSSCHVHMYWCYSQGKRMAA